MATIRHMPTRWTLLLTLSLLAAGCSEAASNDDAGTDDAGEADDAGGAVEGDGKVEPPPEPVCVTGIDCPISHPCLDDGSCDCSDPDVDKDGFPADVCGTVDTDCNDLDPSINPSPDVEDICDGVDNDCDGYVDETIGDDGKQTEKGLHGAFVADLDDDTYGDPSADVLRGCPQELSALGFVALAEAEAAPDRDDSNPRVYPNAPEICDGVDNDDNGQTDEEDENLVTRDIEFTATEVMCRDGRVQLECLNTDTLWCPERIACPQGNDWCTEKWNKGCDVDGTRLSSCRACETSCTFRCGERMEAEDEDGCDPLARVVGGTFHSCGLSEQGVLACWGRGSQGQLGNDSTAGEYVPQPVVRLDRVSQVFAGGSSACAIAGEHDGLYCWGDNREGQLGTIEYLPSGFSTVPLAVDIGDALFYHPDFPSDYPNNLENVTSADMALAHACAVTGDGRLFCWGSPESGRLGNGVLSGDAQQSPTTSYYEDYAEITDASHVTLGTDHGCVLREDETVACWGSNADGQLGLDPSEVASSALVVPVDGLSDVTHVEAGDGFTCALADAQVRCWGRNTDRQLGRDEESEAPLYVPTVVAGLEQVRALSVGDSHSCAVLDDDSLWCWGRSADGQLGSTDESPRGPTQVGLPDGSTLLAAFALAASSCARLQEEGMRCWGSNDFGQLGNGASSPLPVARPQSVQPLEGSLP